MMSHVLYSLSKPTPEILTDYNRKVDFLKGLLEADKLVSRCIIWSPHTQISHRFMTVS